MLPVAILGLLPTIAEAQGVSAAGMPRIGDPPIAHAPGLAGLFWPSGVELHGLAWSRPPVRLRLQLAGVRRGNGPNLLSPRFAEPGVSVERDHATYDRGVCAERYSPRDRGLEFSFLFQSPLAGDGDLVLELAAESEVSLVADSPGVLIRRSDGAGLRIGGVTAIAADGARASSEIEVGDGKLRLRVAERFIQTAEFPLLVDPLVTSLLPGAFGGPAESDYAIGGPLGDIVIAASLELYTTQGTFSRGRWAPIDASGQQIGFSFPLWAAVLGHDKSPRVASVAGRGIFAAAINVEGPSANPLNIHVIDPRVGPSAYPTVIGQRGDVAEIFDLGGESTALDDDLTVVYSRRTGAVFATEVQVEADMTSRQLGEIFLGQSDPGSYLAISKGNGQAGRHMVVWTLDGDLMAAILDRDLQVLDRGRLGLAGA
ncbi:MAG: hypothetical protein AAF628_37230, partial [Planctomycetota bacterium]